MNLRTSVLERLFPYLFRRDDRLPMVRLGSAYGGWWIPDQAIDRESVAYLAGVGEDITFDVELMSRFGCRVVGIDPTPRAEAWVREHAPPDYCFVPVGLAGTSGTATFYAPKNPHHVSHTMVSDFGAGSFNAEVLTLPDLVDRLGDGRVDLLKLDIEGAQHDVLDSMLQSAIRPDILCVEFDQPEPVRVSRATLNILRRSGYAVVKVDGFNVTLILKNRPGK